MTARRGLEVFLFGCRASSGSAQAWKIGAPHENAGSRRTFVEEEELLLLADAPAMRRALSTSRTKSCTVQLLLVDPVLGHRRRLLRRRLLVVAAVADAPVAHALRRAPRPQRSARCRSAEACLAGVVVAERHDGIEAASWCVGRRTRTARGRRRRRAMRRRRRAARRSSKIATSRARGGAVWARTRCTIVGSASARRAAGGRSVTPKRRPPSRGTCVRREPDGRCRAGRRPSAG